MKVYLVIEEYTGDRHKDSRPTSVAVLSAHATIKEAVKKILSERDGMFDAIIDSDENNLSRVSVDEEWDGKSCSLGDDNCRLWRWTVKKLDITT